MERIYRKDYRPSEFLIDTIDLLFELDPAETIVKTKMQLRRNPQAEAATGQLLLHGDELELRAVWLDGARLDGGRFEADAQSLRIHDVPDRFELAMEVAIRPSENTKLMGLYTSSGTFCTQCEAEGFRRITYSLDRPDVMARFAARIEADRAKYPVLLSNGNRVAAGELPGGRHWVQWEDPFPKPSYLFALVAGDLVSHEGAFTTSSGREVALEIWVEPANSDKCEHALASLRAAMRWDEERYGLEYDLDVYMIVAVDDFNMGAMENKGLNVFNSKYVLAKPSTATDDDYEGIEGVVAHEYFHNWTGNRVTCRDWFQLTLKEGLTVFRDQEFSADMTSPAVQRIKDVTRLRTAQFAEDAGPLAHPIRPESYIEMNNFYTATVYEKGAEVVRLYQTLLGREGFRKGLRRYLERHDGCAATCDDFRQAMADANDVDLSQLERWYAQAGTPVVRASGAWDEAAGTYALTLAQSQRVFADEPKPRPLCIPIRVGLVGAEGEDIPGTDRTLELSEDEQTFTFENVRERPVPSIARGFSAPIRLEIERGRDELAFLMAHDSEPFNRWEAGQTFSKGVLLELVGRDLEGGELELDPALVHAFRKVLSDARLDGSIKALTLSLPSEELLSQELSPVHPDAVHRARSFVVRELGAALREDWMSTYAQNSRGTDAIDKAQVARRRLKNRALRYLVALEEPDTIALAVEQFRTATSMTDYEAAYSTLIDLDSPETDRATAEFYERWRGEPLVLDKWFRIQAMSSSPGAFERVVALSHHPDFNLANPNRARSLLFAFASGNPVAFHRPDGEAYRFVADRVVELDAINPQVASRIVSSFNQWKRFEPSRASSMKAELERIASRPGISKDVMEIVERAVER
ncbi:MAG: aminopeptidase N [Deltaproteobacteria bacterium]|nr:aminopeptidase N [Deltaproteobacteria bacterium]NND29939.1 aminopeptidase N [Myxococcales bacterium]MBT8464420.1 aminopeptidase N [Deltaproteobacteria bacterium]MBT8480329.1 aminopeptidase N [Deltaproteobacteria bacterium]NNK06688.1 aminopeptidase N [Myxococcales bacterium]